MHTPENDPSQPRPALIFIPDISGFTRFVTDTEISHARHIIQELLNLLLDANQLGLEVSEVEGDAILFYRFGKPPLAKELLEQVKSMFTGFHHHLQRYESHRICNCGACRTAHSLSIKFVAHYGDVSMNQVRQFTKLFGKEVIVAHRLLKNDIDTHEYVLLTEELTRTYPDWVLGKNQSWGEWQTSIQEYDSGPVAYEYLQLDTLYSEIPQLTPDDYQLTGYTSKIYEIQESIEAPLDLVFDVISDLRWRSKWIPGLLPEIENLNSELPQTGQTHKCMANGPVIVSHEYSITPQTITFSETDTGKTQCVVYRLEKQGELRTLVTVSIFIPRQYLKALMFKLLMKKKTEKVFHESFTNFKAYCNELAVKGRHHHAQVEWA